MRKKIVMVMGVQRSGTTALFDALSHGRITGFNETPGDYIYDNYYLRPEPELRALFDEVPGAVLLKPISETFRRSVREVFEEYAAYDLRIVWIYRDPVNATHSLQILGFKGPVPTVPELAEEWNRRNQSVLDALPFYPGRITIVRYEDLSDSPSMLAALGERLGIEALPNFRGDSAGGRRNMAPEFQTLVDTVTRDTRARLDSARSILPGSGAAPPPCAAAPDASEAAFVHDPLGQLCEARERAGVYHHQQSDTWVVLRYDDVAASLADLERFACNIDYLAQNRLIGSQDLAFHARLRRLLEPHLTPEWTRIYTSRIEQRTRGILKELAVAGEFDLVSAFALRLYMDLEIECSTGREPDSLIARVMADPHFTPQEISDLGSSIPIFLKTLINFIANAVHHLLFHPNQEAALRARPTDISAFVDEVMRLFPSRVRSHQNYQAAA
jgi:hypothetical protein